MMLESYSPYRVAPVARALEVAPVQTAVRWAAFAYQLRKDKAFARHMEKTVLAAMDDYAALMRTVQTALSEALPWLDDFVAGIEAAPLDRKFTAFAQKLDLVAGKVVSEGKQTFTEAGFMLPWETLDDAAQNWLIRAFVSWSESLLSLETRALNQTFPEYADFTIDLKQRLKRPDFAALYVEPEAVDEELWIAFARLPEVRRHLEKQFGRGRQLRTVWALPGRREIANWMALAG